MKNRFFAVAALALGYLTTQPAAAAQQHVVFAGGCFWGMQAVFESLQGVTRVVAGYDGGAAATAHYEIVSTGMTGHAESINVTYDPSRISYRQLLDVYFLVAHDPTELNQQGPDNGSQYRSEIFYTTPDQRSEATQYIAALQQRHVFSAPIVTKVAPDSGFYQAEGYHQDYLVNNPESGYIVVNDMPKLVALREKFPQLVNTSSAPMKTLARR